MNTDIYPSKIGVIMVLIPRGIVGGLALVMAVQEIWRGLIQLLLVSAYIAQLFLNTIMS